MLLPFSDYPFGISSTFIVDPLYTLPLPVGLPVALIARQRGGLRWNALGLGLSTLYLGWSLAAQQYVIAVAGDSLAGDNAPAHKVLVTPTPFNTVLWRLVVMRGDAYRERAMPSRAAWFGALRADGAENRMKWRSWGGYARKRQSMRLAGQTIRAPG